MAGDGTVAIVGGGPAGTAAALTLLKHTARPVVVVERSDYGDMRVGETVSPSLAPLLGYLDVWDRFVADGHRPAYDIATAWGSAQIMSRASLFTGGGEGWHLDRGCFDRSLADAVVARGGTLITRARVAGCRRDGPGQWELTIVGAAGQTTQIADFLVDASGRRASLARYLSRRHRIIDQLVGVVGFYTFADDREQPASLLTEAVPTGWWYSAPLPRERGVATFLTDADIARRHRAAQPDGWAALLESTEHTRRRLAVGQLLRAPSVRSARSQVTEPVAGSDWIAAGDAAASFDPLASLGIGHAIASGIHAARAAHAALAGDSRLLLEYADGVQQNVRDYLVWRRRYYRSEQRWRDCPFWRRRHDDPAVAAEMAEPSRPTD